MVPGVILGRAGRSLMEFLISAIEVDCEGLSQPEGSLGVIESLRRSQGVHQDGKLVMVFHKERGCWDNRGKVAAG